MRKFYVIVGSGIKNGNPDKLADAMAEAGKRHINEKHLEGAYLLGSTL